MFAVIKTGGKQYRVAPNDILRVEKLPGAPGDVIELGPVLLLGGTEGTTLGTPFVEGAVVAAEVLEQARADKVIVFKKKRRKGYRRRHGHRQAETVLRVSEILTEGKKPAQARAKRPAMPVAPDAPAGAAETDVEPAEKKE